MFFNPTAENSSFNSLNELEKTGQIRKAPKITLAVCSMLILFVKKCLRLIASFIMPASWQPRSQGLSDERPRERGWQAGYNPGWDFLHLAG